MDHLLGANRQAQGRLVQGGEEATQPQGHIARRQFPFLGQLPGIAVQGSALLIQIAQILLTQQMKTQFMGVHGQGNLGAAGLADDQPLSLKEEPTRGAGALIRRPDPGREAPLGSLTAHLNRRCNSASSSARVRPRAASSTRLW